MPHQDPDRARPVLKIILLGALAWWLLSLEAFAGAAAGVAEPYWNWSSAISGISSGILAAGGFALWLGCPFALVPSIASWCARRWNGLAPSRNGPLLAWVLGPTWLIAPGLLVAWASAVREARNEVLPAGAATIPAWTHSTYIEVVGHPWWSPALLGVGLCMSAIAASRAVIRWDFTLGCHTCGYDLHGLHQGIACPECGSLPLVISSGPLRPREMPIRRMHHWCGVAAACGIGFGAWTMLHGDRPPAVAIVVLASYAGILVVAAGLSAKEQRQRLLALLWRIAQGVVFGCAWLLVVLGVQAWARNTWPDTSFHAHPWWLFHHGSNVLIPLIVLVAVTAWLVGDVPRLSRSNERADDRTGASTNPTQSQSTPTPETPPATPR